MKDILVMLGKRIRELRKAQGLTQEDLSEKAKLHHTYVGAVERGECNLSLKNIEKIARALGVEVAELFSFPASGEAVDEIERLRANIMGFIKEKDEESLKLISKILKDILEWVDEIKKIGY